MRKFKLFWCAALLAMPLLAHADSVDCSGVPHWNSDHKYKKGDRVWHHEGGNVYELYICDKDQCWGAGKNEPSAGSTWKRRGLCKETPR